MNARYSWIMLNETFSAPLEVDNNFVTAIAETVDEALDIMTMQHGNQILTNNYERRVVKFNITVPIPTIIPNDEDLGYMHLVDKPNPINKTKKTKSVLDEGFLDDPENEIIWKEEK